MKRSPGYLSAVAMLFVLGYPPDVPAFGIDDLQKGLDEALGKAEEIGKTFDKASGTVSTDDEIEIGGKLIAGLLGAAPLVDDPALQRYVNDVGYWIASQSKRKDLPWRFGVIDSDGVNAFAAPGGYIVITLGLYNLLDNEAQLAGVLAHEIEHVVRKHHLKELQKSMQQQFLTDLTIGTIDDEYDQKQVGKLINAGVQLYARGLDRRDEYEADQRGVVLAARAGYDPYALLDVLTTIDSINPDDAEITLMLNTHPPTGDRLERLAKRMDGKMDDYASGRANAVRFRSLSAYP